MLTKEESAKLGFIMDTRNELLKVLADRAESKAVNRIKGKIQKFVFESFKEEKSGAVAVAAQMVADMTIASCFELEKK